MFLSLFYPSWLVPIPKLSYVLFLMYTCIFLYILVLILSNKNKVLAIKIQPSRHIRKNNRKSQVDRRNNKVISELKKDMSDDTGPTYTFLFNQTRLNHSTPPQNPIYFKKKMIQVRTVWGTNHRTTSHHQTKFFSDDDHRHQLVCDDIMMKYKRNTSMTRKKGRWRWRMEE